MFNDDDFSLSYFCRYVEEEEASCAAAKAPRLIENANRTPKPGVKFGSITLTIKLSMSSGNALPEVLLHASTVIPIPARTNKTVDIATPAFRIYSFDVLIIRRAMEHYNMIV